MFNRGSYAVRCSACEKRCVLYYLSYSDGTLAGDIIPDGVPSICPFRDRLFNATTK